MGTWALGGFLSESSSWGLPQRSEGKNLPVMQERPMLDPWVRKTPWRREWLPTPVFLPGESHGQRSLVGYSPWGSQRVSHDRNN